MDVLKTAIKCAECKKVLEKPVTLTCGNSVCLKHLDNLDSNRTFTCKVCGELHQIEQKININKALELLISANIVNINLGSEYNDAFDSCNQLELIVHDLETVRKDPSYFIGETITKLRNKTDVLREEHKLKIDEKADNIIQKLNAYEQECNARLASEEYNQRISNVDASLTQIKQSLAEWQAVINDFGSNEDQWKTIKTDCNASCTKLKSESLDLKIDLLMDNLYNHLKLIYEFQESNVKLDTDLEKEFESFDLFLIGSLMKNSKILDIKLTKELLNLCEFPRDKKWKLIYQASEHGFGTSHFHAKCDNIANTVTIIKSSTGEISGAYTSIAWDQSASYKNDPNAFIFSLVNKYNKALKLPIQTNLDNAIYCNATYGPTFGGGHDIYIADISNQNTTSYSKLGHTYLSTDSHGFNNQEYLFGSYNFTVADIEVYQIS